MAKAEIAAIILGAIPIISLLIIPEYIAMKVVHIQVLGILGLGDYHRMTLPHRRPTPTDPPRVGLQEQVHLLT